MTGFIVAIVLFPLIGIAIGRIAGPVQPFLAGAGATGTILFIAGVLHVPLLAALSLLVAGAIVVVIVKPAPPRDTARHERLPTCIAALMVVVLLVVAVVVRLDDYDGRAFWLLKAKAIAHDRSVDGPFFQQQESFSPRNQYPLLVPIDAALLMIAGRELDDRQARCLFVLFAAAFALELRRRLGAWTAAIFLCLPAIVSPAAGALSAGSDIALGAFAACTFFEIADGRSPFRAGMWLSFVTLTKSEGLPLAIVLLLA